MKLKNKYCIPMAVFLVVIAVFTLLLLFMPKKNYSENEKRVLAEFPEFSFSALFDGSYTKEVESYISDHFPFRDFFVGVNSYVDQYTGRGNQNGVYLLSDGSLVSEPGNGGTVDIDRVERYMNMFNSFASKMELDASIMLVPTPGDMKEDLLPMNHEEYLDDEIFDVVEKNAGELNFIDLRTVFENEQGIYYNTDHHVTSYGSHLMYLEYCKSVGITPCESFTDVEAIEGFYGTNYSKSGLWLTKPDTVEIYHSTNNYKYRVTIEDGGEKNEYDSLYFYDHKENLDKYPIFLDGNHAVTTIENESNKNGKKLLILKDSYAHCFSTFLCENYETIILVDLRYYRGAVSQLIEDNEINELLFLYGAENLASISDIGLLR